METTKKKKKTIAKTENTYALLQKSLAPLKHSSQKNQASVIQSFNTHITTRHIDRYPVQRNCSERTGTKQALNVSTFNDQQRVEDQHLLERSGDTPIMPNVSCFYAQEPV